MEMTSQDTQATPPRGASARFLPKSSGPCAGARDSVAPWFVAARSRHTRNRVAQHSLVASCNRGSPVDIAGIDLVPLLIGAPRCAACSGALVTTGVTSERPQNAHADC